MALRIGPSITAMSVILSRGMFCCFLNSHPLRAFRERSVRSIPRFSYCFLWAKYPKTVQTGIKKIPTIVIRSMKLDINHQ